VRNEIPKCSIREHDESPEEEEKRGGERSCGFLTASISIPSHTNDAVSYHQRNLRSRIQYYKLEWIRDRDFLLIYLLLLWKPIFAEVDSRKDDSIQIELKKMLYKHTTICTIQDKKEGVIWFFKIIILTELRWVNTFVFVKHSMSRLHEETVVTRITYSYHRSLLQRDTKSVVSGLVSWVLISQMKDCFLGNNVSPCPHCYWV